MQCHTILPMWRWGENHLCAQSRHLTTALLKSVCFDFSMTIAEMETTHVCCWPLRWPCLAGLPMVSVAEELPDPRPARLSLAPEAGAAPCAVRGSSA